MAGTVQKEKQHGEPTAHFADALIRSCIGWTGFCSSSGLKMETISRRRVGVAGLPIRWRTLWPVRKVVGIDAWAPVWRSRVTNVLNAGFADRPLLREEVG